jgi:hypothetical protein
MPTSYLIAGISPTGDVSINFTASLLRFQADLARASDTVAAFDFFESISTAIDHFHRDASFDVLVLIDAGMAIDPVFFIEYDSTKPFVVGVYPLGKIDWARVEKKIGLACTEDASKIGNIYSIDPRKGSIQGRYIVVKTAGLGIVKLGRCVLDEIIAKHGTKVLSKDGKLVLHAAGIENGTAMSADERLCHLWGGNIYADTKYHTKSSGPVAFSGCVGTRTKLR